ncbi:MAG: DUF5681 domain-containing protein, partial [Rickettsiales bacterium]
SKDKDYYEVGYKKPPKKHQFKPGQSGNVRGRPKQSMNLRDIYEEVLLWPETIVVNGEKLTVNGLKTILMQQKAKAMKGDTAAAKFLTDFALKLRMEDFFLEDEDEEDW